MFFNRRGKSATAASEQQQRYRASGLNLVTAAIAMEHGLSGRAANALRGYGQAVDDGLLKVPVAARLGAHQPDRRLPLRSSAKIGAGKFRPLRPLQPA